jgi:outer membrane protein
MNTMKKALLAAGIAAIAALSGPALAADAAGTSFGVVDMSKVMQTTDAAKDIFSQMEAKRKEYQAQISKEEDSIRSSEQELVKQKDTLSKEDFAAKRGAFEEKVIKGQKMLQDRKRTLDQAFNTAMGKLRHEAAKIVASIAKEKGYGAVFTEEAVMISSPALDMTEAVVAQMNKNVKKIPIDWKVAADGPSDKKK